MASSSENKMSLTAGAARSIECAVKLAREHNLPSVGLPHLLIGLLTDESVAQELLHELRVTGELVLESELWQDTGEIPQANSVAPNCAVPRPESSVCELDSEVENVIARAKGIANRNRADEIGSIHLLCALAEVPSEVASYLQERGVNRDRLGLSITRFAPPMQVEFEIELEQMELDPSDEKARLESQPVLRKTRVFQEARTDVTPDAICSRANPGRAGVLRILDASANRAREGLRVVEDFCRFVWDDAFLCEQLKSVRHDLAAALVELGSPAWVAFRDTQQDVGTSISTAAEHVRGSGIDVVAASLKRIEEAFRSLEEYSKLVQDDRTDGIDGDCASDRRSDIAGARQTLPSARIEQLRYRIYTIEKAICARERSGRLLKQHSLYLLLTQKSCSLSVEDVLLGAIKGGVSIVQIREKDMSDRDLLAHARRARTLTRQHGVLLIMNDRPDLAVLCDADGVHVGQDELSVREARQIVGADSLVGVSTHSIEQARQAVLNGADYIGVGPVFPSRTKDFATFAGLDLVREVAGEISLPWFPIGGINLENAERVIEAGATRLAVSNCICSDEDPASVADRLCAAMRDRDA